MSQSFRETDMTRLIEALLTTPRAGREVARALGQQGEERAARTVIAEMRARRAEHARERALGEAEARRMGSVAGDGTSPWSRSR